MSGQQRKWSRCLILPLMVLTAAAARADQTTRYEVRGPTGAAMWGLSTVPGTQVIAFAFSQVAPLKESTPAGAAQANPPTPGPRVTFSVSQMTFVNGEWVRRQWFGDAPLKPESLVIASDLTEGKLDTTVPGTLEEYRMSGAAVVRRDVPGRVQVQWLGSSDLANTTLAYSYQTPSYAAILQTAGTGRMARVTGTVTVEALGAPIEVWGLGSLSAVVGGLLSVSMP